MPRLHLTGPMLWSVLGGIGANYLERNVAMLSAGVTLALFGMLQPSENTAPEPRVLVPDSTLSIVDVILDWDRRAMLVRLTGSKTDLWVGFMIRVCATGTVLCQF